MLAFIINAKVYVKIGHEAIEIASLCWFLLYVSFGSSTKVALIL